MSVHVRNLVVSSKEDEKFVDDDRNNNLKNDQVIDESIERQRTMIDQHHSEFDIQKWHRNENSQRKHQSGQHKMERHSSDIRSSELYSSKLVTTTKSNTSINFSVDSILNGSNVTKKCDAERFSDIDINSSVDYSNSLTSTIADDFKRIHRPMPMRYLHSPGLLQGNQL